MTLTQFLVHLGRHIAPQFSQISLFSLYAYMYFYIYIYVCMCAYMHKHPRNVDVSELNFSYHLFIFGL